MKPDEEYATLPLIKVVGVSASGKSTLVRALRKRGYRARPVSQEHSNVPSLWQQFEEPTVLIHLDISLEAQRHRRPDVSWDKPSLREEMARLAEAQDNADLKIDTSELGATTVLQIALSFLSKAKIRHADHPLPPLRATGSALVPMSRQEGEDGGDENEDTKVESKAGKRRKKHKTPRT